MNPTIIMAIILSLFSQVETNQTSVNDESAELIYVGDPMCSWCYGFTQEFAKLKEKWEDKVRFRLVMGGLRPFTEDPMDEEMRSFLKKHWEEIGEMTGQPFSYVILEQQDFVYDTEPAARAVVVVRKMKPEAAFPFFKAVQEQFYVKNSNTNNIETYLELLPQFEIDAGKFRELYISETMKISTEHDFAFSDRMEIEGFPTLILKKNGKYKVITFGYSAFEEMDKKLGKYLK